MILQLPKSMKAAQVKFYGGIDEMITVEESVPVPRLDDELVFKEKLHPMIKGSLKKDRLTHMIIKTLAVSLSPADYRILSGRTRLFQGPPSFPYIPGGDCCGIVVDPGNSTYFKKGDVVSARFAAVPRDGIAEYARVSSSVCEKVDTKKISPVAAAALASASPAAILCEQIRPNERVLILGAGGGVGSHLCQLARMKGASYICGLSRDPKRLLDAPLLCDDAIDYTKENIYVSKKFQQEPFDTIIDLACGGWPQLVEHSHLKIPSIVKPASQGGRYITIGGVDKPYFDGTSIFGLLGLFLFKPLWRYLSSRIFTRRSLPSYSCVHCLPDTRDVMTKTLGLANEGKLQGVVDGPYPMTTEGVRKAFHTLQSRHGKGKVVVKVADL
eukprot:CAMPEP_0185728792 /NCGR_PEP_ID=MMETSP1171-20130828/4191_1 /TAXON_ID=374046 /ORGANISM="Helicotheca tamensis, Strain CCMP826" /LENGTH=383 /DNA_ID=CAMNT_0028397535 /DNA_START=32 /DNA_END=1183 /DNA_ORIENTATION=+